MNDEIKEILDRLFVYRNENDEMKYEPEDILITEDIWLLLDYITNLQQENEYLKKHQRFHKKFGNDYIFCLEGDKETYKDLIFELQERIDKAITILNERKEKCEDISWVEMRRESYYEECDEIINLLKGDDENEEK